VANSISEAGLKLLHDDFLRLSEKTDGSVSAFTWSEPQEMLRPEVLEFVSRYNEVVFYENIFAETIEDVEAVRGRVLGQEFYPTGLLETLPRGDACVWWSMPISDKYLLLFDRLCKRAVGLIGPQFPEYAGDCESRISWISMARHITRSGDWYEPHDKVLMEPMDDEEFLRWSKGREGYPQTEKRWVGGVEKLLRNIPFDLMESLGTHLAYMTVVGLRTLGRTVPLILSENLGNAAIYSATAIELIQQAQQRSIAESQSGVSFRGNTVSDTENKDRRAELGETLDDLFESSRISDLFNKGSRQLSSASTDKAFSMKELAKLAGRSGEESASSFKNEMRNLKRAGVFKIGDGPYRLTDYGRELFGYFLERGKTGLGQGPGQGPGQGRG
jgi:hypothetical protein